MAVVVTRYYYSTQGFVKSHGLFQVSLTALSRFCKLSWFIPSFPHGTLKVVYSPMVYLKFPSRYSQSFVTSHGLLGGSNN